MTLKWKTVILIADSLSRLIGGTASRVQSFSDFCKQFASVRVANQEK